MRLLLCIRMNCSKRCRIQTSICSVFNIHTSFWYPFHIPRSSLSYSLLDGSFSRFFDFLIVLFDLHHYFSPEMSNPFMPCAVLSWMMINIWLRKCVRVTTKQTRNESLEHFLHLLNNVLWLPTTEHTYLFTCS
jgi:hypothetical protein